MKKDKQTSIPLQPLSALALVGAVLFGCLPALAMGTPPPTSVTITNHSHHAVYANLVLGQPPTTLPNDCTNLGQQILSVTDPNLVFISSVPSKKVTFTPWTPGVTDQGYYHLAAGETITYRPQRFPCGSSSCSPALSFNVFLTPNSYNGTPNNGCGGSTVFPNATNLAEASVNFAINGSAGSGCANADGADLSAVNGINSFLELKLTGSGWPLHQAANRGFGKNANNPGVLGWAATGCNSDTNPPNPSGTCPAPVNAPQAPASGQCTTPKGAQYPPIVFGGASYCAELSDAATCISQRPAGVTGGVVAIIFRGFYKPASPAKKAAAR